MCKKTSITIGMAIAIILTAYISALTSSNQVFAQAGGGGGWLVGHSGVLSQTNVKVLGHVPHVGQILAGHLGEVVGGRH